MNILKHPAIRAIGDIVAAVADALLGSPLNFAMRFRRNWVIVMLAVAMYWIIGAAVYELFGPIGVGVTAMLLGIWCLAPRKVR